MNSRRLSLAALCASLSACAPPVLSLRPPPVVAPSASSAEVTHRTGTFQGAGGVELFEQSWRPANGARAVLVIVHGLKSHSGRYEDVAVRLVAHGVAVYAFDQRGHGRSAGRRASLDDFDDPVSDVMTFLARVREAEPNLPVFLAGHSAGGAVVTLCTLERHPPIAGLILLAPALRIDRGPVEVAATPITGFLTPNLPLVDTPDELFSRSPEVVRSMHDDPLIYHPVGPARTGAGLVGALGRIWALVDTLDVPVLGLHGTADRLTDPRGTAELVRRARTTDRTLLLYRGLYHDLVHEPERDQVMTDIERWIDAHLRG